MQRRAARPTSSASTSVRPASSRTRWNSRGPSPSATPDQIDVYGFMRSPVDERGSSWSMTSRSRQRGRTFSIPTTETRTSGRVVHMRPLPSDSSTTTWPVSATAKFAPLTPTGTERNFARRCARAAAVSSAGSSETSTTRSRRKSAAIWARLRWMAGTRRGEEGEGGGEDGRGGVVGGLVDELGEVGLHGVHADRLEAIVEVDLVRGQRLDLDDLGGAVGTGDVGHHGGGLGAVARPVHGPARVLDGLLQALEVDVEVAQRAVLDLRAGVAQRLPVGHLADHPRALAADRRGRVAEVAPQLAVGQRGARRLWEAVLHASSMARISARCITRTPAREWRRPPPMCIRHELSAAVQTSAPVSTIRRSLSVSMAVEVSAFLTAKVPPKPQH